MNSTKINHSLVSLPVQTASCMHFFRPDEIIRLEASSNYTRIFFTNRSPVVVARVLASYESILSAHGFIRTHRSHLINVHHILYIAGSGQIIMRDSSTAEISRRKKKDVMRSLRSGTIAA